MVAIVAGIVNYTVTDRFELDRRDRTTGFIISVFLALVVWYLNKSKWLPLGDGSYTYIPADKKNLQQKAISHYTEPIEYDAVFRNALFDQLILAVCGIVAIAFGIRLLTSTSIIFPLAIAAIGLFVLVTSSKGLADRKPKLKLSKKGLWTRKLGFQPWTAIKKTQVTKETGSRTTQVYLEIYLKESALAEAGYPDERFSFWGIEKSTAIEDLVNQLKSS